VLHNISSNLHDVTAICAGRQAAPISQPQVHVAPSGVGSTKQGPGTDSGNTHKDLNSKH
jgi:hypothetical protein